MHVTQQFAGHGDFQPTLDYHLLVQTDDLAKAKLVQAKMISGFGGCTTHCPKTDRSASKA
jgi:hypothetical protein